MRVSEDNGSHTADGYSYLSRTTVYLTTVSGGHYGEKTGYDFH